MQQKKFNLNEELNRLNSEQQRAAIHTTGSVLVLAGAGSGKTRVVALRIAYLIAQGISASNILGLTFTNKAAQEMKERVNSFVGQNVLISTFHSLGVKILRESIHHLGYSRDFSIYDEEDVEKLLKTLSKEVVSGEAKIDLKVARKTISSWKNSLLLPEALGVIETPEFGLLYELYIRRMKEYNAVDFDDLLFLPAHLFRTFPEVLSIYQARWRYLLVDEYQDTNAVQYELVRLLVATHKNLFVVGDPDQSIYSWRGANINNILNFEKDYPGSITIRLEQNYRSTKTILQAANSVIQNNAQRFKKSLWSDGKEGEKIGIFQAATERDEAGFVSRAIQKLNTTHNIPLNDMVIFYRTNFQSRVFEDEFLQKRIPYVIVGGISFYLRREVKDILSFLRLLEYPNDIVSFMRVVNLPKRGFGEKFLEKIILTAREAGMPLLSFFKQVAQQQSFSLLNFSVSEKQRNGWTDFATIMQQLQNIKETKSLAEVVQAAISETKYLEVIDADPESKQERRENLGELTVKAIEWETAQEGPLQEGLAQESSANKNSLLAKFLEEISLVSATDGLDPDQEHVCLMTAHNGKGLEFRIVFLVGMEEELFPHINSYKSHDGMEEERRLFYVGITRAKEQLFISHVALRHLWGGIRSMRQSRFLREIPEQLRKKTTEQSFDLKQSFDSMQNFNVKQAPAAPVAAPVAAAIKQFVCGEIVFHPDFGVGRVEAIQESSLGATYQVLFQKDNASRKLLASHAPLSSIHK